MQKAGGAISWIAWITITIFVLVWWLVLQLDTNHANFSNFSFNLGYALPYLFAGGWMIKRGVLWRLSSSVDAFGLWLLGISFLCYVSAQVGWTYANFQGMEVPSAGPADVLYVMASLFQLGGFGWLLFHPHGERMRQSAFGLILFIPIISYVVVTQTPVISLDQIFLGASACSGFLLFMNIHRARHPELRTFFFLMFLAVTINAFGDVLYAIHANSGTYWNGGMSDGMYMVSGLIFFLSCLFLSKETSHGALGQLDSFKRECASPLVMLFFGFLLAVWSSSFVTGLLQSSGMTGPDMLVGLHAISVGTFLAIFLLIGAFATVLYLILSERSLLARELERKTAALSQFVSLVAHQLRAPMTQLRWMAEHVATRPKLPKEVRESLVQMEQMIGAEAKLVGNLLNVSRIERGVLKLDIKQVLVADILKHVVAPYLHQAEIQQIQLLVLPVDKKLTVRVDEEKVVEAIRNLLDNAIKYAPHGSTVRLKVSEKSSPDVVIELNDQGPGIPEELLPTLFDIKQSASMAGGSASTGLGLYLTKQFITAVGGEVSYQTSQKGTSFFVRLPRRVASSPSKD